MNTTSIPRSFSTAFSQALRPLQNEIDTVGETVVLVTFVALATLALYYSLQMGKKGGAFDDRLVKSLTPNLHKAKPPEVPLSAELHKDTLLVSKKLKVAGEDLAPLKTKEQTKSITKNTEPPPHTNECKATPCALLKNANTAEEVLGFLETQKNVKRIYQEDSSKELTSENAKAYFVRVEDSVIQKLQRIVSLCLTNAPLAEPDINQKRLFHQINRDLGAHHDGASRLILDGVTYDGSSGKDAQSIFDALRTDKSSKQETLQLMTLLQQGVFASLQEKITNELDLGDGMDAAFRISGEGDGYLSQELEQIRTEIKQTKDDDERIDLERGAFIREYRIENNVLTCSCKFELKAADFEKTAIYRNRPYAIIEAKVEIDLTKNAASESWQVTKVISH